MEELLQAIELGDVQIYRKGFSFEIWFRGWNKDCPCDTCTRQVKAFEFLKDKARMETEA